MSEYTIFQHGRIIYQMLVTGIMLILNSTVVQAQSNPSPNLNMPSGQFNDFQPIMPQYFYPSTSGSQQFFRQDSDRLYFLPEEKSEPILKIDKTIEAEGIDYEDLQEDSNQSEQ